MAVVVTGAAGHIGANLIRGLSAAGRPVRALVHRDTRGLEGVEGVERVPGDVLQRDSLVRAFEGAEAVYHLAAKISIVGDRDGSVRVINVDGTRNVVTACLEAGVGRLVHFSSVHALEPRPLDVPVDEDRPPVDQRAPAYDRTKAEAERVVLDGVRQGLDAVLVSPGAVIGRDDYKPSRMGEFFLDLTRGRMPALIDGGYDFVDVRDVTAGAMLAEEKGRTGERYILGAGWRSVSELSRVWSEVAGVKVPRWACPIWLARLGAPFSVAVARLRGARPRLTSEALTALSGNRNISHAKATRELGYSPRPLRDTLTDIHGWFRERGLLDRRTRPGV